MAAKRQSLGKGLDALLGIPEDAETLQDQAVIDSSQELLAQTLADAVSPADGSLQNLPVEFLHPGQYQPRRDLNSEALQELADSIATQGVMQPIIVRPTGDNKYEIIAGERRWRATQQAGLDTIPAIVREVTDEATIAMALIENIQREDLNAMEESLALIRLRDEFKLTQQQVADAVSKSRSAVTNLMRLASLEKAVQQQLERGELELGHAKCLLGLEGNAQIEAARSVAANAMTVRQTEVLVKKLQNPSPDTKPQAPNPDIMRLQEELSEKLGAAVSIQHSAKGAGKLIFKYNSVDELDGILAHLK
ncbi:ParB/RepB/Spo0J family partition protein [SAR92 clade bacterium H231]|jgi:ParB family chromosome partitioning protein|nr:ParB/RepB/Spo0J family partition protein [Porticoccaceae bacterium]MCT2532953.1 ParB/RepB/Spo0J family partition protein [SAR92 clade bacterium H231]MBT7258115.1 ParB/RepB/Spo0J family partition protein [Porticoccaceae bacterium]MBT7905614.1 ParB/RepB/Spo0J family partition protein [Porticoccaceae bacterium]MDA9839447.1 ParB/RepB/Spo0J family partition protein [Porticoccaceae bacterium]